MKTALLNGCLLASAVALLATNIYLRGTPVAAETRIAPQARGAEKNNPLPTQSVPASQPKPAPATAAIHWAPLESEDYPQYMANLRNFGFPEELIRQLVEDEMDALYAPRIDPLRTKPIPHDAPQSERNRWSTMEDIARLRELQKLLIEKRDRLEELVGGNVPREMIRTPVSRNYEAYEYAVSQLPPEKQEAARVILEKSILDDDENIARLGKGTHAEMQAYAAMHETREEELKRLLTPGEFDHLELNVMPQGTELQREIIGMEATDQELLGIFKVADELWYKNGGVGGRWRANGVPGDQITRNDADAEGKIQQLLGPDRYTDYRMARSDTGRQLNNLAARYDLPRETTREAFAAQTELDKYTSKIPGDAHPDWEQRKVELSQKLQELLGPHVFEAWESGRNQKYKIEP